MIRSLLFSKRSHRLLALAGLLLAGTCSPSIPESEPVEVPPFGGPAAEESGQTEAVAQPPSATPAPTLRQLTTGGCCVQPSWNPQSDRVLYLDRPSPEAPAGLYAVGLEGGEPALYTDRLGAYSDDFSLLAYPQGDVTIVARPADGALWSVANGGRAVVFSPDSQRLAWTAGQSGPPFDTARRSIWISNIDGSEARQLIEVFGGGFAGWLPDGRLLISGKLDRAAEEWGLWSLMPDGSQVEELYQGDRIRRGRLSPGGRWLAYQTTFNEDPARNGFWLIEVPGGQPCKLDLFGAFRWRDENRLLVIPLDLESPSHRLWQIEAECGETIALTDTTTTPFKVANGDWSVSPDGRQLVFVSAADHNLWLMGLP